MRLSGNWIAIPILTMLAFVILAKLIYQSMVDCLSSLYSLLIKQK